MAEIIAALFILLLFCMLGLHVFGLPGNWVILLLIGVWRYFHPELDWGWGFLSLLLLLSLVAEVLEFFSQYFGAKRYGATSRGGWGAMLGAIVGAIMGAPFFLGVGALLGGLAGAFAGALLVEILGERSFPEAKQAAWGALWGKFFGMVAKVVIGVFMLFLTVPRIWPG